MILQLESQEELDYCEFLSDYINETIESQDPQAIKTIRSFWDNESWDSIVKKFNTEGSIWYMWWMEGVRAYMRLEYVV